MQQDSLTSSGVELTVGRKLAGLDEAYNVFHVPIYTYEPPHDNTNISTVRPAKSLGLAVRMKKARVLSYSLSAQRRL